MLPLVLFFTVFGIGAALGMQTGVVFDSIRVEICLLIHVAGYAINPARDLGPRLFTAMAGYGRHGTYHNGITYENLLT